MSAVSAQKPTAHNETRAGLLARFGPLVALANLLLVSPPSGGELRGSAINGRIINGQHVIKAAFRPTRLGRGGQMYSRSFPADYLQRRVCLCNAPDCAGSDPVGLRLDSSGQLLANHKAALLPASSLASLERVHRAPIVRLINSAALAPVGGERSRQGASLTSDA